MGLPSLQFFIVDTGRTSLSIGLMLSFPASRAQSCSEVHTLSRLSHVCHTVTFVTHLSHICRAVLFRGSHICHVCHIYHIVTFGTHLSHICHICRAVLFGGSHTCPAATKSCLMLVPPSTLNTNLTENRNSGWQGGSKRMQKRVHAVLNKHTALLPAQSACVIPPHFLSKGKPE